MAASVFDHPFLSGLFGDDEAASLFTAEADIQAMLAFETALAGAQADAGVIPAAAADAIAAACGGFEPDLAALRAATAKDGVVIPELVRQLRRAAGDAHGAFVHHGATSQDAIDTSLMLRLKPFAALLAARLEQLDAALARLADRYGSRTLMGRTRMQAAMAIAVADRIGAWRAPLIRHGARLRSLAPSLLVVQFGGAAGTLDTLGGKGEAVRRGLAARLELGDGAQWHSQRDRLAEFAGLLSLISGTLGKFGQDIALLAQAGDEIVLEGGGSSSAMPHKSNPVAAELLVTLAGFNALQLSGLHLALVHEQERSGSAWSLEWMLLPQMAVATAASLRLAQQVMETIRSIGRD